VRELASHVSADIHTVALALGHKDIRMVATRNLTRAKKLLRKLFVGG